jgi:hypothetical protein
MDTFLEAGLYIRCTGRVITAIFDLPDLSLSLG